MDLTLNGRQTTVIQPELLAAYARPHPSSGLPTLPLSLLFPWLESVEYIELYSGSNPVDWKSVRLGPERWSDAEMIRRGEAWEIHTDGDVFINTNRIAVGGTRMEIPTIRIWSAIDDAVFERELNVALSFRDVVLEWHRVEQPAHLLTDPPTDGLPHLILLDDLDLMRSASLLTTYRSVSAVSSQWFTRNSPEKTSVQNPWPLSLDAYAAETSLNWLLAANPDLFDAQGRLPDALVGLLEFPTQEAQRVINSEDPMKALSSGEASSALSPAGETAEQAAIYPNYNILPPPSRTVNVLRNRYAAVPRMLPVQDRRVGELLLADAMRFKHLSGNPAALPLPVDSRTLRFFEAYQRIGRLALSSQMDAHEAVELINAYVNKN